jgi:hypothetical protein
MFRKVSLCVLLFAVPLLAQQSGQPNERKEQGSNPSRRRLESLNWNPVTGKLTWAVSQGSRNAQGEYVPDHEQIVYEIDLPQAVMSHNGAERRFSKEEAANVLTVMGLISKYAQDSTMWWESGKGEGVGQRVQLTPEQGFFPLAPAPPFRLRLASLE